MRRLAQSPSRRWRRESQLGGPALVSSPLQPAIYHPRRAAPAATTSTTQTSRGRRTSRNATAFDALPTIDAGPWYCNEIYSIVLIEGHCCYIVFGVRRIFFDRIERAKTAESLTGVPEHTEMGPPSINFMTLTQPAPQPYPHNHLREAHTAHTSPPPSHTELFFFRCV